MSSCFAVRRASSGGEEEETGGIGEAKGAHDTMLPQGPPDFQEGRGSERQSNSHKSS